MMAVYESNPARVHVRPNDMRDVVITFHQRSPSGGTLTGYTPANQIFPCDYTVTADQGLSVPALNITKVAEHEWGAYFVDHITTAQRYHFENGALWITATGNRLVFKRHF